MTEIKERLAGLDSAILAGLYGRSLLETRTWARAEIDNLCEIVEIFAGLDRAGIATDLFPNESHLALFFDSSTRTRSSWAGATSRLGARPAIFDGAVTQVGHGETAEETGTMLGMTCHALGIRHDLVLGEGQKFLREAKKGIDGYLRDTGDSRQVPVINLQCDVDHPTQTLADLCWLKERFPEGLAGRKIAVSWAYSPSDAKPLSVPQGLITLLTRFGMPVQLAHPEGYDLTEETMATARHFSEEGGGSFSTTSSMDEAFEGADIVYPKSWGPYDLMLERVDSSGDSKAMAAIEARALERNSLHMDWICNEERMASTRGGEALYMHCLPADIGAEVSAGILEGARWDLAREANKKLYVMMAALAVAKERNLAGRLEELSNP